VSEQFLELLKFLFLGFLYLFFIWVVVMTLLQLRKPKKPKPQGETVRELQNQHPVSSLMTIEPEDSQGTEYLIEEEIFLGRAEECTIAISDTFASHRHARVFLEDSALYLEDLTSTNGTFVNGEKIEKPYLLKYRDRIQIGNTVLEAK
tara:strand:+ start:547 stop:990 length:444 start_codon:yes stop_codon:yes gene_type:complete